MAGRLGAHQSITPTQRRRKKPEEKRPPSFLYAYHNSLPEDEQPWYFHQVIMQNMAYFKAVVKHQHKVATYLPHNLHHHKNHHLLSRLTESGLSVMQMQFAKKPKNPV